MKYLQKQQLLEQVIYLSMWLLILCIPPINLLLDDDHTLQAGELKNVILETGMLVLPFFVLFLIHNFLLIPQLFLKKYYQIHACRDLYNRHPFPVYAKMAGSPASRTTPQRTKGKNF